MDTVMVITGLFLLITHSLGGYGTWKRAFGSAVDDILFIASIFAALVWGICFSTYFF